MPPIQLLCQTAHPGSDRRPPRTGLARARFNNPSNKERDGMSQDCTVAPAHLQGSPYQKPIPVDVAALAHPTLLPQVVGQPRPFRQGQQVLSLLEQQGLRMMPCRPMCPPTGYTIAPVQGLPIQVGRVGEAHTGPQIAPGVIDPALHLTLGLGPVGPAQPKLETHPQGESSIHQFHSGRLDSSQPTTILVLSHGHCRWWPGCLPRITMVWAWTVGYSQFLLYYMGFLGASVSVRSPFCA